jgi:DNA mismatch endonuclease (patch repair protein)
MSKIHGKDTKPEKIVRGIVSNCGYRYTTNLRQLPGKPDLVFSHRSKAIFVHGCFWHGHTCTSGRLPKSNKRFWEKKIASNKDRDVRSVRALRSLGYNVLTIWQCELHDRRAVRDSIVAFLGRKSSHRVRARSKDMIPRKSH